MKDPGVTICRWLTNFSYFQFTIEHRAGVQLCDADHLSCHLNLPTATPSEIAQTREYETTHPLPYPLDQFQSLIDVEQPVGGGCGTVECEPGDRCEKCVNMMETHNRAESLLVNAMTEPEPYPCLTSEETEPAMTWQLLLAAQQSCHILFCTPTAG